jgi:hypothetical protein
MWQVSYAFQAKQVVNWQKICATAGTHMWIEKMKGIFKKIFEEGYHVGGLYPTS